VSPRLAAATHDFLQAVVGRAEAMLAVRAPHLSPAQRARCAKVSVQLVRALLPRVVATDPAERDAMVAELKAAQRGTWNRSSALSCLRAGRIPLRHVRRDA
jgi:hypothetical protein